MWDAQDYGFMKFAWGALHKAILHEMTKIFAMREARWHLLLENQKSYASCASCTSYPKANCKAQSAYKIQFTQKTKKGNGKWQNLNS